MAAPVAIKFEDHFPTELYAKTDPTLGTSVGSNMTMSSTSPWTFTGGIVLSGGLNITQTITPLTAASTLSATQTGGMFLLNNAAGFKTTLPAAAVGLTFQFIVQTSVTSGTMEVTVGSTNGFLIGLVQSAASSGGATDQWVGNGTSHIGVAMSGSTTGGIQGSNFSITCITTGLWQVDGQLAGSGTLATPFTTT
jgi:hypothetical protein